MEIGQLLQEPRDIHLEDMLFATLMISLFLQADSTNVLCPF